MLPANLVPTDITAQLNGRIALKVKDTQSSRMILEKTGAQGYDISVEELDEAVEEVISENNWWVIKQERSFRIEIVQD